MIKRLTLSSKVLPVWKKSNFIFPFGMSWSLLTIRHSNSKMKNEFKYGDAQYRLQKYILITLLFIKFWFNWFVKSPWAQPFGVYSSQHHKGQAQGDLTNRLNQNLIKALWSGCISAAYNECIHTKILFSFSDLNA